MNLLRGNGRVATSKVKKVLVVGVGMAVFFVGFLLHDLPQPEFQGKSLDEWLEELRPTIVWVSTNGAGSSRITGVAMAEAIHLRRHQFGPIDGESEKLAVQAILGMGTNAIPFLLKHLERTDSALKLEVADWIWSVSPSNFPGVLERAEGMRAQALSAVRILGCRFWGSLN